MTKTAGDHKELSLTHELVGLYIHLLASVVGVGVGILALAGGLLSTRVGTNLGLHLHLPPRGCETLTK